MSIPPLFGSFLKMPSMIGAMREPSLLAWPPLARLVVHGIRCSLLRLCHEDGSLCWCFSACYATQHTPDAARLLT